MVENCLQCSCEDSAGCGASWHTLAALEYLPTRRRTPQRSQKDGQESVHSSALVGSRRGLRRSDRNSTLSLESGAMCCDQLASFLECYRVSSPWSSSSTLRGLRRDVWGNNRNERVAFLESTRVHSTRGLNVGRQSGSTRPTCSRCRRSTASHRRRRTTASHRRRTARYQRRTWRTLETPSNREILQPSVLFETKK